MQSLENKEKSFQTSNMSKNLKTNKFNKYLIINFIIKKNKSHNLANKGELL